MEIKKNNCKVIKIIIYCATDNKLSSIFRRNKNIDSVQKVQWTKAVLSIIQNFNSCKVKHKSEIEAQISDKNYRIWFKFLAIVMEIAWCVNYKAVKVNYTSYDSDCIPLNTENAIEGQVLLLIRE